MSETLNALSEGWFQNEGKKVEARITEMLQDGRLTQAERKEILSSLEALKASKDEIIIQSVNKILMFAIENKYSGFHSQLWGEYIALPQKEAPKVAVVSIEQKHKNISQLSHALQDAAPLAPSQRERLYDAKKIGEVYAQALKEKIIEAIPSFATLSPEQQFQQLNMKLQKVRDYAKTQAEAKAKQKAEEKDAIQKQKQQEQQALANKEMMEKTQLVSMIQKSPLYLQTSLQEPFNKKLTECRKNCTSIEAQSHFDTHVGEVRAQFQSITNDTIGNTYENIFIKNLPNGQYQIHFSNDGELTYPNITMTVKSLEKPDPKSLQQSLVAATWKHMNTKIDQTFRA